MHSHTFAIAHGLNDPYAQSTAAALEIMQPQPRFIDSIYEFFYSWGHSEMEDRPYVELIGFCPAETLIDHGADPRGDLLLYRIVVR